MDYIIKGGGRLRGEIGVYGAKNCALALLGATILTDDEVILNNCPQITDVDNMLKLLASMGKTVIRRGDEVKVSGALTTIEADSGLATLLRGSALILGSCIARYHQVTLPLPGGCAIGSRPMDIHLNGLEAFGVEVEFEEKQVQCKGVPREGYYRMRFASVGATENLLCCCSLTEGICELENCACEPEVVALEEMLVKMGVQIDGVGSSHLVIKGVKKLHGVYFDIIPDRIVAATYLSAAIASKGNITVTNCIPEHLGAFLGIIERHFDVKRYDTAIKLTVNNQPSGYGRIVTAPYPLFPTDMQSLLMSLAAFSNKGDTVIVEKLFENRLLHHANELNKMGANISVQGEFARITGSALKGADTQAQDLRGGAALVVAALNANGTSTIRGVEHINRGYVNLAENLRKLGANITEKE